jgi:NDP-sugar pyrophosphorylase family protein
MFLPEDYLDLSQTKHGLIFEKTENVWEALREIGPYLQFSLRASVNAELIGRPLIGENVFVGKGTVIENGAVIKGPAWIGENCEIRNGCYIRENVIVGDDVVLGNSCEFKNCLIFNGAQIPHFNYVGDSILGYKAHLGAGVILSNVKLDHQEIHVKGSNGMIATGLKKFGAIVGDYAEIGCNSVMSPGSLIGRNSMVYPGCQWKGVLPAHSIAKVRQTVEIVSRKEDA